VTALILSIAFIVYSNNLIAHYFLPADFVEDMQKNHLTGKIVYTSIFLLGISTSIKVTQNWYENEKQKNIIKNEKLNSELSFLKSQVNPHFLFNTLNNIYSLANRKSEYTADAIMKLSHLMRYMLYDAKKNKVDLQNEINYLADYIELQKLRMPDKSKVIFNIEGNSENMQIEPMLLIPFVENAFKHGDIFSDNAKIDILLKIKNNELYFMVENNIDMKAVTEKDDVNGIGLDNLRKRLELLYPEKHKFIIKIEDDLFISSLKIKFK
ncbi:MAG: histidine kinase, partial [Chlorobi bacterium]|nr:histidine kinase [Chlorobiota bacterium]